MSASLGTCDFMHVRLQEVPHELLNCPNKCVILATKIVVGYTLMRKDAESKVALVLWRAEDQDLLFQISLLHFIWFRISFVHLLFTVLSIFVLS